MGSPYADAWCAGSVPRGTGVSRPVIQRRRPAHDESGEWIGWWARRDSNSRPPDYQSMILTRRPNGWASVCREAWCSTTELRATVRAAIAVAACVLLLSCCFPRTIGCQTANAPPGRLAQVGREEPLPIRGGRHPLRCAPSCADPCTAMPHPAQRASDLRVGFPTDARRARAAPERAEGRARDRVQAGMAGRMRDVEVALRVDWHRTRARDAVKDVVKVPETRKSHHRGSPGATTVASG